MEHCSLSVMTVTAELVVRNIISASTQKYVVKISEVNFYVLRVHANWHELEERKNLRIYCIVYSRILVVCSQNIQGQSHQCTACVHSGLCCVY